MSPTTRSARAGGAALREGTPISAGHDVSVAPRLDGSWVVQPREGRSAASHPPRTGPPKDAHGLFTPLVDALDHGPGNGCVSHDPAFAAWRDNLRVRDAAVYRAAPRIDDTAADVGKTAAAGHRRRGSSAPTRDPSRRDDENRDPAEKSSCVVVGVGVGVDVGPDTRREPTRRERRRAPSDLRRPTEDEDADASTPSGWPRLLRSLRRARTRADALRQRGGPRARRCPGSHGASHDATRGDGVVRSIEPPPRRRAARRRSRSPTTPPFRRGSRATAGCMV